MSDTPRTDVLLRQHGFVPADSARQLERELAAARAQITAYSGYVTADRDRLAAEKRGAEALAKIRIDELAAENAALKQALGDIKVVVRGDRPYWTEDSTVTRSRKQIAEIIDAAIDAALASEAKEPR